MNFEQPKAFEANRPNNRLSELGGPDGFIFQSKIEDNVAKMSIGTQRKEKMIKQNTLKFEAIRKLKDKYEERWHTMNPAVKQQKELSAGQKEQRKRFVDIIGKEEIMQELERWQTYCNEEASKEGIPEEEKEYLYAYIDALQELQGDVANW